MTQSTSSPRTIWCPTICLPSFDTRPYATSSRDALSGLGIEELGECSFGVVVVSMQHEVLPIRRPTARPEVGIRDVHLGWRRHPPSETSIGLSACCGIADVRRVDDRRAGANTLRCRRPGCRGLGPCRWWYRRGRSFAADVPGVRADRRCDDRDPLPFGDQAIESVSAVDERLVLRFDRPLPSAFVIASYWPTSARRKNARRVPSRDQRGASSTPGRSRSPSGLR